MKNKTIIKELQNINNDDIIILSQILDQATICDRAYKPTFTSFIDMYNLSNSLKLFSKLNIKNAILFGGYKEAERKIIGFYPPYFENDFVNSFPISVLEIKPQINKFKLNRLSHRDYLGSLLGLGITRNKIGDILVFDCAAYVFVENNISQYILMNLSKVGAINVDVSIKMDNEFIVPKPNYKVLNITVPSLRLDALISHALAINRGNSSKLIANNKVFINGKCELSSSKNVKDGDLISVRGYGRLQVQSVGSITKKGRIHITLYKFV